MTPSPLMKEGYLMTASDYCMEMLKYERYMWFYVFMSVVDPELMSNVGPAKKVKKTKKGKK